MALGVEILYFLKMEFLYLYLGKLIFIAFPSLEVLYIIGDNYSLSLAIKRIGHQWYWSYEYRDFKDLEFDSYIVTRNFRLLETDNSVVLPVKSHICSLTLVQMLFILEQFLL